MSDDKKSWQDTPEGREIIRKQVDKFLREQREKDKAAQERRIDDCLKEAAKKIKEQRGGAE